MSATEKDLEKAGEEALKGLREAVEEVNETEIMENTTSTSLEEIKDKLAREIELSPEEAAIYATYAAEKARICQVMTRGVTNDKLRFYMDNAVPEGRVGKFIRDNSDDITRYQNLNYAFIYTEDVPKGLHAEADGRIRVGDVVLMTISKEHLDILREVRRERKNWKLDQGGRQEYVAKSSEFEHGAGRGLVSSFDESSQRHVKARN